MNKICTESSPGIIFLVCIRKKVDFTKNVLAGIVNGFQSLSLFTKSFILDV